jgi:AraC-like DNA-binding protein
MIQIVRLGARSDWRPARICVERDPIPQMDRLEAFAEAEVLPEAGVSGVAIPRSVLSRLMPFPAATEPVEADRIYADAPSDEFVASLRQVLRSLVRFGHPRIETAAEIGGLHVRTLQRRLRTGGLSFKKLVDQSRFLEAVDLMGENDLPLVEIAHELGHTDQAHFTVAFRRWAGVPPARYWSQLHAD